MTDKEKFMAILETVSDPEVPVLSVVDLGIIRDLEMEGDTLVIKITPTYTGCPAMQMMEANIRAAFDQARIPVRIMTVLSPPWTTDWMSERGKEKLKAYGIAPPYKRASTRTDLFAEDDPIPCPRCQSIRTQKVSEFGSTACKALYRCLDCLEPFDYFKCH